MEKKLLLGIGIDLVEHGRFADWVIGRKKNVFTSDELDFVTNDDKSNEDKNLANFWAARGAALKALGASFGTDITYKDISVKYDATGTPSLLLTGGAQTVLKSLTKGKKVSVHLSITDQSEFSAAVVFIETL